MHYDFGNYLYFLRSESHLTQKELAARLSVSDKAVSKWGKRLVSSPKCQIKRNCRVFPRFDRRAFDGRKVRAAKQRRSERPFSRRKRVSSP